MKIAVVIPCYKVTAHIGKLIPQIGADVTAIYCVDDACPDKSGDFIKKNINDTRVKVLYNETNQGVGGAMITGYRAALADNMDIIVKLDGDGQMDPALIPAFTAPISEGLCDYTKGNRFHKLDDLEDMPRIRLIGNALLSFLTKLSSGYWHVFDPTNGYTAIHGAVLRELPLEKISKGYFFESDMLFRLNITNAVVRDIPMRAVYEDEQSNLNIRAIVFNFLAMHAKNFYKRIFYSYFLRDFSIASIQLLLGIAFMLFGLIFGSVKWWLAAEEGVTASAGTVMLSALPVLIGVQMILSFLQFDMQSKVRPPAHKDLTRLAQATGISAEGRKNAA